MESRDENRGEHVAAEPAQEFGQNPAQEPVRDRKRPIPHPEVAPTPDDNDRPQPWYDTRARPVPEPARERTRPVPRPGTPPSPEARPDPQFRTTKDRDEPGPNPSEPVRGSQTYVLECSATAPCALVTTDARRVLHEAVVSHRPSRAGDATKDFATASATTQDTAPSHKLFVVHPSVDFDSTLTCDALQIDQHFVDAHSNMQRYRPRGWRRRTGVPDATAPQPTAVIYQFPVMPELIVYARQDQVDWDRPGSRRRAISRPRRSLSVERRVERERIERRDGPPDYVAEELRVERHDVLPERVERVERVERTEYSERGSEMPDFTGRRRLYTREWHPLTMGFAGLWEGPGRASALLLNDRLPGAPTNFEDELLDAINDAPPPYEAVASDSRRDVHGAIAQLVYDQWMALLDDFISNKPRHPKLAETGYPDPEVWRTLEVSLEENVWNARQQRKTDASRSTAVTPDDWMRLMERLARVKAIVVSRAEEESREAFRAPPPVPRHLPRRLSRRLPRRPRRMPSQRSYDVDEWERTSLRGPRHIPINVDGINDSASPPLSPPGTSAPSSASRVTYMGGILLPFSIVAGIMSMSDPFGPGNNMFWLYWAVTLPLTAITLLVIYADEIRRSDVWEQMGPDWYHEALRKGEVLALSTMDTLNGSIDKEKPGYLDADADEADERPAPPAVVRLPHDPPTVVRMSHNERVDVEHEAGSNELDVEASLHSAPASLGPGSATAPVPGPGEPSAPPAIIPVSRIQVTVEDEVDCNDELGHAVHHGRVVRKFRLFHPRMPRMPGFGRTHSLPPDNRVQTPPKTQPSQTEASVPHGIRRNRRVHRRGRRYNSPDEEEGEDDDEDDDEDEDDDDETSDEFYSRTGRIGGRLPTVRRRASASDRRRRPTWDDEPGRRREYLGRRARPANINIARPGYPDVVVTSGPDGSEHMYRRQQLGWAGAFKTMVGYKTGRKA